MHPLACSISTSPSLLWHALRAQCRAHDHRFDISQPAKGPHIPNTGLAILANTCAGTVRPLASW